MLRHVMPRARLRQWPVLGVVFAAGAAIVPVAAMASGEVIPTGDGTTTGAVVGGIAVAAVGGLVKVAQVLASRGSNGPSPAPSAVTGAPAGHGERIAVLEARMEHKDERDREHAHLLDELRKALSEQARAVDRAVAGNAEIIAEIRRLAGSTDPGGGSEG